MKSFTLRVVAVAALTALGLSGQVMAAAPGADHPAVQRALQHLTGNGFQAAKASLADAYTATDLIVDADGAEHVRFSRSYKGLPVIAGDLIVRNNADGSLHGVINTQSEAVALDVRPTLSAGKAGDLGLAAFKHQNGQLVGQQLVVYARNGKPVLAWQVEVHGVRHDGTPSETHMVVHAHSGKVLDSWDMVHTAGATSTGKTLYLGDVTLDTLVNGKGTSWQLTDTVRGNQYTVTMNNGTTTETKIKAKDNIFGDSTEGDKQTVAADAHYGMALTWDYYKNVHGRSGIANDGKGARSRVHYSSNYDNAFWSDSCFCMTYGDGNAFNPLVSIDVAGHEMTHGVTSRTAKLIYSNESGGLNEATSDIMGTMVEFYANNPADPGDYLIGEKLYNVAGKALRYMSQPNKDGASSDCWYSGVGGLDVHYSSGVANHFFFLLAEGTTNGVPSKTCVSGNTKTATGTGSLVGIGRDAAAKIWYRALTTKMLSGETFANARTHTIAAAEELYGVGSTQALAVAAAWTAVNRN
jgi:Zn-dependent metalloprotease